MIQPEKNKQICRRRKFTYPLFYRLQRKSIGDIEPFK